MTNNSTLTIQAAATVTGRRVKVVAYRSGAKMRVDGFRYPVQLAVEAIEIPDRVPLLADHMNSLGALCGHVEAFVENGDILADGKLNATQAAQELQAILADDPVEASVGIAVHKQEVQSDDEGKFILVTAGRLKEISCVALGACADTEIILARGKITMADNETTQAAEAPADELSQMIENAKTMISNLQSMIDGLEGADPNEPAIESNYGVQTVSDVRGTLERRLQATQRKLADLRSGRRTAPTPSKRSSGATDNAVLEAAAVSFIRDSEAAARCYGDEAADRADALGISSFAELAASHLRSSGSGVPRGREAVIRAALQPMLRAAGSPSYASLTNVLENALEKMAAREFAEIEPTWQKFCDTLSPKTFNPAKPVRADLIGDLEKLGPGGEIEHGEIGDDGYSIAADTYAKKVTLTRKDWINDDASALANMPKAFAMMAHRTISNLIFNHSTGGINQNPSSHWHTDNANALTTALSVDALSAAIALLRAQTDGSGNYIDIAPKTLVVGPALEGTARSVLNSTELERTGDGAAKGNPWSSLGLDLAVEPRLADDSATVWYLFASPMWAPWYVSFLNGKSTPTIETFGPDSDPNTLSITWRAYIDFGHGAGDVRASVKSTGAG